MATFIPYAPLPPINMPALTATIEKVVDRLENNSHFGVTTVGTDQLAAAIKAYNEIVAYHNQLAVNIIIERDALLAERLKP